MKINTLLELSVDVFNVSKETEMRYETDFINSVMKVNFSHLWPFFLMEWVQIFLSHSKFFACVNRPIPLKMPYFNYYFILVIDLIYWRCLKKTGIVVVTGLVLLFSLTMYTFLSVVTFFSMALLTVSLLYRVGMTVMGAIQKTGTDNPFK